MLKIFFNLMSEATLTLPAMEVTLLLAALSCCLVLKLTRTGLIIAYLFIYRWAWLIMKDSGHDFLLLFLVFGVIIGVLTVISMLRSTPDN